jgi:hypothetical protein
MNELILELAKQAGLKKEHASDREYIGNFDWRLFAELIVQKCVTIVALHGISNFENEDISWVCDKIVKEINEQFGEK